MRSTPRRLPKVSLAAAVLCAAGAATLGCAAHAGDRVRVTREGPGRRDPIPPEVLALHHAAIVLDGHSDTAQRLLDERIDFGLRLPDGHMDLPRLREGGVDAQLFAAWIDPGYAPHRAFARADSLLDAVIE